MSTVHVDMQPDEHGRLLYARTHPKILIGPAILQLVLLGLHWLAWQYLPVALGWLSFLPDDIHDMVTLIVPIIVHVVILIIEIAYVIVPILKWRNTKFIITEGTVLMTWGVLYRGSREIQIDRITQVELDQGFIDMLFGCGTIYLHSPASDPVMLDDVPKVKEAKVILERLIH